MEDTQYNKAKTIIAGANALARELESWINISSHTKEKYNIVGCLLDDKYVKDANLAVPVIGQVDLSVFPENHELLVGITDCKFKEFIFEESKINNVKITSFIHNTSLIGLRTMLGIGIVMLPYSLISCDATIGNLVFINNGSQIGHDVIIGNFCSIMANVDIGGNAQIGKNVLIGSNAVILPGVKIPDNTIIGAGSVVIRTIKQSGSYFGNPAKKIF